MFYCITCFRNWSTFTTVHLICMRYARNWSILTEAALYTVFLLTYYLFCRVGGDGMSTDYVRNEILRIDPLTSLHLPSVCLSARNGWRTAEWGYDI